MTPLSHRRILHPDYLLVAIKLLHTAVWAIMAGSILALPVAAFTGRFRWVLILTALIVCECPVLAANRGRCPLTDCAARYTEDRAANFDIYLPEWLARNNKPIFGTLFAVNELIVLWRWAGSTVKDTLKAGVLYFILVFAAGFVLPCAAGHSPIMSETRLEPQPQIPNSAGV